jgi:hypothetical protein
MQNQDDLAALFSRNLSLQQPAPYTEPAPEIRQTTPPQQAITYSITQHYHHSAHVAAQATAPKPPRPVSQSNSTDQLTTDIILARHGVDVTTLFPSQIELFKTADASQQMRLVELWRISPPNYGGHALAKDVGTWPATTFEQEEAMAQVRFERQIMDEQASRAQNTEPVEISDDMMSDGEQSNAPLTPIQGGDSRWGGSHHVEPYMASGYETLAAREYDLSARQQPKDIYSVFGTHIGGAAYVQKTDPVYASPTNGWMTRTAEQQQQAMENQYGAFSHNHQLNGGFCYVGRYSQDEEML